MAGWTWNDSISEWVNELVWLIKNPDEEWHWGEHTATNKRVEISIWTANEGCNCHTIGGRFPRFTRRERKAVYAAIEARKAADAINSFKRAK